MKQGNVGAFLTRKPKLPLSGASTVPARVRRHLASQHRSLESEIPARVKGEEIASSLRLALKSAAKPYPNKELFNRLCTKLENSVSLAAYCEGLVELSRSRTLMMPDWRRVAASLNAVCESLMLAATGCHVQTWLDGQDAQRVGDRTQERVMFGGESVTVAELNEAIVALEIEIDHDRQTLANLHAMKRDRLATLAGMRS